MKSFTVEIDTLGNVETKLKGYEERSPELAAIVEGATGTRTAQDWRPGQHAHVVNGKTVTHSH